MNLQTTANKKKKKKAIKLRDYSGQEPRKINFYVWGGVSFDGGGPRAKMFFKVFPFKNITSQDHSGFVSH